MKRFIFLVVFTLIVIASNIGYAAEVPVKVAPVVQAPITKNLKVHATIYGHRDVTLTAGVGGLLTYVVEPGTHVKAGEYIAKIDMLPLEIELAEQKALIKRAELNAAFYQKELTRLMSLAKSDSASAFQIDQTEHKLNMAQSDIELAKIKLTHLNDKINRANVKSPFSGVISKRFQQAGGDINRADDLVHLLDTEILELRLFIPIKYLSYTKMGQSLYFSGRYSNNASLNKAKISSIIPATDARSQTFEIRAEIELNKQQTWAIGQLVEVELPLQQAEVTTMVNRDALIIRGDGIHVVKIDENRQAQKIAVEVGKGQGQMVEISILDKEHPLRDGDRVAIRGAERLDNGQLVNIQNDDKKRS